MSKLTGEKWEKTVIISIRNEKRDITIDLVDAIMIIKGYYEQFYANKLKNSDEMENF